MFMGMICQTHEDLKYNSERPVQAEIVNYVGHTGGSRDGGYIDGDIRRKTRHFIQNKQQQQQQTKTLNKIYQKEH